MAKHRYRLVSHINLLPWREDRRDELRKEYFFVLFFACVVAAGVWFVGHTYHAQLRDDQNARLAYVQGHIDDLDKKLVEIKKLQTERQSLLTRIRAIEELQGNRSLVVRLFDEIVDSIPEELTLSKIEQTGNTIKLTGVAQSNASVSDLMKRIDESDWIADPVLQVIEKKLVDRTIEEGQKYTLGDFNEKTLGSGGGRYLGVSYFELTFKQVIPVSGKVEEQL